MEQVQAGDCTERVVLLGLGLNALTIASVATGLTITDPILAGMLTNSASAGSLVVNRDSF